MISEKQRAEIKRLYCTERWKKGTIAKTLGLHHQTITNALERDGLIKGLSKASKFISYHPIAEEILLKYPRLRATRVHHMLKERGYSGSVYTTRRMVRKLRPQQHKAFQDLQFFPGEVAQVDWADCGKHEVSPGVFRRLQCFVMVLGYSRSDVCEVFL